MLNNSSATAQKRVHTPAPGRRVIGLFLGCLLGCSAFAEAHAATILHYESSLFGEPPLGRPTAVSLSSFDGTICITDAASQTLNVFDDRGIHQFRTTAISSISNPIDASVDEAGGFVFLDSETASSKTIKRLNFLGEPEDFTIERPTPKWSPYHLIVTGDGHYLTLDRTGLLVKHDSENGTIIWKFRLLDEESEFVDLMSRPAEAPDGTIYIPHSGARAMFVVSREGGSLSSFGTPGSRTGEFAFPAGVAFGPEGQILVLDRMRHRVLVFDSEHTFQYEFGRWGSAPGELFHPVAITASSNGRVWIAQGFEGKVQTFRLIDTSELPEPSSPATAHGY